jgi:hypothetical protein
LGRRRVDDVRRDRRNDDLLLVHRHFCLFIFQSLLFERVCFTYFFSLIHKDWTSRDRWRTFDSILKGLMVSFQLN